eukprot:6909657-Lingulodinium_polyedra.AAC.1
MLLELDNGELMDLLDSEQQLGGAVEAALGVLATDGTAADGTDQHLSDPGSGVAASAGTEA